MKRTVWFVLATAVTLFVVLGAPISDTPLPVLAQAPGLDVVQTDAGQIAPARDSTAEVRIYKMVPYAAPPVSDLRWKPPQPVAPWQGVRKADLFSPMCMQAMRSPTNLYYNGHQGVSEDCLYLNVWTPAKTGGGKLPVIVLTPPGTNTSNAASQPQIDGTGFAKKGIVFVGINYRLGALGFLAHPDLTKESGTNKASGNYGIMDQIAALKWVQKNIAAFGGDPNNVTIYGGPTVSLNITHLTATPLAKGLFHRAIGGSVSGWSSALAAAQGVKLAAAEQAGADWGKKNFNAGTLAELRARTPWDLLKVALPYTLIVDGYVIPDFIDNIYSKGQQNDVPLLLGWNKDEGIPLAVMASTVVSYTAAAKTRFGKFADQFLQVYPATTDAEALAQSYALNRDDYAWLQRAWARAHDKTGKTKTYLYHWTYAPPWSPGVKFDGIDSAAKLGAYHFGDIAYTFGTLGVFAAQRRYTDMDYKLSDTVQSYWVNFAKTGDPNGPGLPVWPVFDENVDNPVLYLGAQIQPGPILNKKGLDIFEAYYNSLKTPVQ